jgi:secondary thiamine-phosphate synthase enzyme
VREIAVRSERRTQLIDVTSDVRQALSGELDGASAVLVFCPHTTAGLTMNEHADPAVARDLEAALERIVDDGWDWQHIEAGEANAPSHVRVSLTSQQLVVPVTDRQLVLGTWQGIFFCEFDGPRTRKLYVTALR